MLTQVPSRTTQRLRSGWQSDSVQPSLRAGMFPSPRPGCIPGRVSAHSPGKRQGLREQEERQSPSRPRFRSPARRPLSPRHSYRSASGTPTASFAHAGIAQRHRGEGPTRAEDSEAEVSSGRASVPGGGHPRAATEIGRHRAAPSTEPTQGPEITRPHIARSPIPNRRTDAEKRRFRSRTAISSAVALVPRPYPPGEAAARLRTAENHPASEELTEPTSAMPGPQGLPRVPASGHPEQARPIRLHSLQFAPDHRTMVTDPPTEQRIAGVATR